MSPPAFAAPASISARSSFAPHNALSPLPRVPMCANRPRRAAVSMVSKTNLAVKEKKIDAVKARLEACQMLFATDLSGLSVAQVYNLKRKLPPTTTIMTVKNTLMRRAIEDSKWEAAGEFATESNMWFFIQDDFKGTVDVYEEFVRELKREPIKGGVFDGERYDEPGITAIAALPSKKELITQIAVAIKMVPTKLGRSVKMVPTKLARAIKLALAEEKGADAPADVPAE